MNTLERMLAVPAPAPAPRAAAALARLRAGGLPAGRHEDWRYANLAALDAVADFSAPPDAPAVPGELELPAPLSGHVRLLVTDGRLVGPLPAGLRSVAPAISDAGAAAEDPRGLNRFGQLATARAPGVIALEADGVLDLELLLVATRADAASYCAIELRLTPGARVRLAERQLGAAGARGLVCGALDLGLAAGASLEHQRLLHLEGSGAHLDTLTATLADGARYAQRCLAVGAGTLRSTQSISLAGRDARLDWQGLAVAAAREVRDLLLFVAHEAPGTGSRQVFRGIADAHGRVACGADTLVAADAPGTRLSQSLRGLLDGNGAEVDLKPRLTILTDDVQAAHGATTGRLDEDLLFYLLARGLDASEARALLKWAFLGEVFAGCEPPALRLAAEQAIAARLRDRPPGELLR